MSWDFLYLDEDIPGERRRRRRLRGLRSNPHFFNCCCTSDVHSCIIGSDTFDRPDENPVDPSNWEAVNGSGRVESNSLVISSSSALLRFKTPLPPGAGGFYVRTRATPNGNSDEVKVIVNYGGGTDGTDIFLYPGEAAPADIKLRDPTVAGGPPPPPPPGSDYYYARIKWGTTAQPWLGYISLHHVVAGNDLELTRRARYHDPNEGEQLIEVWFGENLEFTGQSSTSSIHNIFACHTFNGFGNNQGSSIWAAWYRVQSVTPGSFAGLGTGTISGDIEFSSVEFFVHEIGCEQFYHTCQFQISLYDNTHPISNPPTSIPLDWEVISGTWQIDGPADPFPNRLTTTSANAMILSRCYNPYEQGSGVVEFDPFYTSTPNGTAPSQFAYRFFFNYEDINNYAFIECEPTTAVGYVRFYLRRDGVTVLKHEVPYDYITNFVVNPFLSPGTIWGENDAGVGLMNLLTAGNSFFATIGFQIDGRLRWGLGTGTLNTTSRAAFGNIAAYTYNYHGDNEDGTPIQEQSQEADCLRIPAIICRGNFEHELTLTVPPGTFKVGFCNLPCLYEGTFTLYHLGTHGGTHHYWQMFPLQTVFHVGPLQGDCAGAGAPNQDIENWTWQLAWTNGNFELTLVRFGEILSQNIVWTVSASSPQCDWPSAITLTNASGSTGQGAWDVDPNTSLTVTKAA